MYIIQKKKKKKRHVYYKLSNLLPLNQILIPLLHVIILYVITKYNLRYLLNLVQYCSLF
jgi:hypothetical protein